MIIKFEEIVSFLLVRKWILISLARNITQNKHQKSVLRKE